MVDLSFLVGRGYFSAFFHLFGESTSSDPSVYAPNKQTSAIENP